tara:strand:- start:3260 stop:3976 length:717 start_codon:yes stop_codon:yes gene_type:complete
MAPGEFNGKNYGGLHSGCGKKLKKGKYSLDGYEHKIVSHKKLIPGKEVIDIRNGNVGMIKEYNNGPRTMKKIYIPSLDVNMYIYTKFLRIKSKNIQNKIIECKSYSKKETEKFNKYLENKKKNEEKIKKEKKEKKEKRLLVRKMKKELREKINDNIYISEDGINLLKSDSNIVNEINKERYLRIIELQNKNKLKLLRDRNSVMLNKLTQDGSTDSLCLNISNSTDYFCLIDEYIKEQL